MPRIRTLKPEHKQHRKIGPLSDHLYRLWVGLITEADDEGRLVAEPDQLRVTIFGYQQALPDLQQSLEALAKVGLLILYTVDGVQYAAFPSWGDHQRISHAAPSKLPTPERSVNPPESSGVLRSVPGGDSGTFRRETPERSAGIGRDGKGKERKGREAPETISAPIALNGDGAGENGTELTPDQWPEHIAKGAGELARKFTVAAARTPAPDESDTPF